MIHLHPLPYSGELPEKFTYPFCYQPHPAAVMAARVVREYLETKEEWREELKRGKMFGVLVVDGLFFVAAYSGLLAGRNDHEYFVPPVFDSQQPDGHFKTEERRISALSKAGRETRHYSLNLQRWLFSQYNIMNAWGESRNIIDIFNDHYSTLKGKRPRISPSPLLGGDGGGLELLPPSGSGDCCAPKLLQYAYLNGLKPVCMAEFWYGDSPKGEIRHHLQYYPACSGKCKPLLAHMLKGLDVEPNPQEAAVKGKLKVVYEDEDFVVVDKPVGMPSVPGKIDVKDVVTWLNEKTTDFRSGVTTEQTVFPVHRLDMATSGLLLLTKSAELCKTMQGMFARREVRKEYVAVVEGLSGELLQRLRSEGKITISLPLARDTMNRPYQKVDYEKGKEAVTEIRLLEGATTLLLHPLTGRTHQLRMHCAHPDGLNAPIKGDGLYGKAATEGQGKAADRLYLHSQRLEFYHPITGEKMIFFSPPDFIDKKSLPLQP